MGIIIMFGAYLPDDILIVSSVIAVCLADTAIALLAGLVILPVLFLNHLTPDSGPSLIFQTLPLAFFTSIISLLEPEIVWLIENHHSSCNKVVALLGFICWALTFGTILSFSHAPHFSHLGFTFFQRIDFLTSDIWNSHNFWFRC